MNRSLERFGLLFATMLLGAVLLRLVDVGVYGGASPPWGFREDMILASSGVLMALAIVLFIRGERERRGES